MTTRDAIRAGLYTALFAFIGLFFPGLVGWLSSVGEWADSEGNAPFPAFSSLGYLAVSALSAAIAGAVNALYRLAQARGVIPGKGPVYRDQT